VSQSLFSSPEDDNVNENANVIVNLDDLEDNMNANGNDEVENVNEHTEGTSDKLLNHVN